MLCDISAGHQPEHGGTEREAPQQAVNLIARLYMSSPCHSLHSLWLYRQSQTVFTCVPEFQQHPASVIMRRGRQIYM